MTKRECAVVMAHTGIVMLTGDNLGIFYKCLNDIMGRPVYTHELAFKEIQEKIKEKSTDDFLKLCREASNALEQQRDDCVSREQAKTDVIPNSLYTSEQVIALLDNLSSVTPTRKVSKWIDGHCANCGCDVPAYINDWKWEKDMNAKWCPQCGAEMRGAEE